MIRKTTFKNECLTCPLTCNLKEKKGKITLGDLLAKAPKDCPYLIQIQSSIIEGMKNCYDSLESYYNSLNHILAQVDWVKLLNLKELESLYKKIIPQIPSSFITPESIRIDAALQKLYSQIASQIAVSYYPQKELEVVFKPTTIPPKSQAAILIQKLSQCKRGFKYWREYQAMCREILCYLFVPPLGEPLGELKTKTGLQRRDLIFPISYNANGFWQMISNKYGANALIVDCKNNSDPIGKKEILLTSQYLSKKKLGNFALILTRVSPSDSAQKEIERLWRDEEKMIICIEDGELKTMIQLKENKEEPEKLLDKKILDFLVSLE